MSIPNYYKKDFLEDHQKRPYIRSLDEQIIEGLHPRPQRTTTARGQKVFKNKQCPYCSHRYPSGSSKRNKQTSSFFWMTNPDGYRFKCLRCGASKTLYQYLVDNESYELAGQYQWDRFRHGCTGKDQNCKNPDPDSMKAYKSWAYSSVDKPPAFEERREFYRQQQQRQKEHNWIQKHGCPYPHRQDD